MADATGAQELFEKGFGYYSSEDESQISKAYDLFM